MIVSMLDGAEMREARGGRGDGTGASRARAAVPILAAVLIPLVILVVSYIVQTPRYALPDDYVQDLFVSGRFLNEPSALMPYTLALVSVPLSWLYAALPGVPWYALMLCVLIVVSFAVAFRTLFQLRIPRVTRALALAFLVLCDLLVTWYLTYTIVAFVATAAGLALIVPRASFEEPCGPRPADACAVVLVALGFSLRPESGFATFVIFSPFVVWVVARNRHVSSFVRIAVMVLTLVLCYGAGQAAYRLTPGWEQFPGYLDAGRRVLDYPRASYEKLEAVAPELSENDVEMMYDWNISDTDVFSIDLFKRLDAAVDSYDVSNLGASNLAQSYLALAGIVVIAAIAAVLCCGKGVTAAERALLAGVALMAAVCFLAILLRDRTRIHVVIPLIAAAFFALMTAARVQGRPAALGRHARAEKPDAARHRVRDGVVAGAFAVACLVVALGFNVRYVVPMQRQRTMALQENIASFLEKHPDDLCIFLGTQGGLMGDDAFSYVAWSYPHNALFAAGWEAYTAPWERFLAEWGLERGDVLQQLAQRDDMRAVMLESDVDVMERYLQEHVDPRVTVELEQDLGSGVITKTHTGIYRFYIAE